LPNAALPQREQDGRQLRGHRCVENQPQRRKQDVKPLDFLSARDAAQRRIDERDLDGAAADRFERDVPGGRARHGESRGDCPPQFLELQVRNRSQYQHFPPYPPEKFPNAAKSP